MKYLAFGLTVETEINFRDVLQTSSAPIDIVVRQGTVVEKCGRPTRIQRRGIKLKFGGSEDCTIFKWDSVGKFKITNGNEITYENLGADEDTLKLFLLSEVFGAILYQRGLFLLHASAVDVGGKALVFMGVPGAGKSTTAAAFGTAGLTVLTDDLTAIQIRNGQPFVVPAFAQYKVWKSSLVGLNIDFSNLKPSFEGADKFLITQPLEKFPRQPVPLMQLNILLPSTAKLENNVINPVIAPVKLLEHFPLPVQLLTKDFLQTHFRQAFEIAQFAPLNLMKRPEDFAGLERFVESLKSRNNPTTPTEL